jgi:F0F1-type ATP synthase assembly protein I
MGRKWERRWRHSWGWGEVGGGGEGEVVIEAFYVSFLSYFLFACLLAFVLFCFVFNRFARKNLKALYTGNSLTCPG